MAERLTDRGELTDKPAANDWFHLVDRSNTTDDPNGTSVKQQIQNLFKGRAFQYILGCLVYKINATPTTTTIQNTDIVIYINSGTDRMVVGIAGSGVTTIPDDLDDSNKFTKFYEGNSLAP